MVNEHDFFETFAFVNLCCVMLIHGSPSHSITAIKSRFSEHINVKGNILVWSSASVFVILSTATLSPRRNKFCKPYASKHLYLATRCNFANDSPLTQYQHGPSFDFTSVFTYTCTYTCTLQQQNWKLKTNWLTLNQISCKLKPIQLNQMNETSVLLTLSPCAIKQIVGSLKQL